MKRMMPFAALVLPLGCQVTVDAKSADPGGRQEHVRFLALTPADVETIRDRCPASIEDGAPLVVELLTSLDSLYPDDQGTERFAQVEALMEGKGYVGWSRFPLADHVDLHVVRFLNDPVEIANFTEAQSIERAESLLWRANLAFGESLSNGMYFRVPRRSSAEALRVLRSDPSLARGTYEPR